VSCCHTDIYAYAYRFVYTAFKQQLHFCVCSLLTGTINIKVLPEDSCVNWGAIMLRMLPWSVVTRKDLVMSILKAMAANPQIAQEAPKLTPKMSADKIVRMAHQVQTHTLL
jgi:hypothetical protein